MILGTSPRGLMAVLWWCHVKFLISWHFLLLSCHVWKPNQTVFGLLGSPTLFLSLSLPPDPFSVSSSSLCRCAIQRSDGRHCFPTRLNLKKSLRAEEPGLWSWLQTLAGSVLCERERPFSERTDGNLSVRLEKQAKCFSVSKFFWLLIETYK